MPLMCEACERAEADVTEPCDDQQEPYRVCSACQCRLQARALRPLEWYNLSKRHGWHQFLLHDDFYTEDGAAEQPVVEVENPQSYPAPALAEVASNPKQLLDYSITRWHLTNDLKAVWATHPSPAILPALCERFAGTKNTGVRSRILQICASAVKGFAADFIRYAWGEFPNSVDLLSLGEASAACLPPQEGFDRVVAALKTIEGNHKRDLMSSLAFFHSRDALDWIEQNIFSPVTESWGYLAAGSCFDWPHAERWFKHGRPLSLVAIDALVAIVRPQSPHLRTFSPLLHSPPHLESFRNVLEQYARKDPAPRVQQRVAFLLSHGTALVQTS